MMGKLIEAVAVVGEKGITFLAGDRKIQITDKPCGDIAFHNGQLYHSERVSNTDNNLGSLARICETATGKQIGEPYEILRWAETPLLGLISYNGYLLAFSNQQSPEGTNAINEGVIWNGFTGSEDRILSGRVIHCMTKNRGKLYHMDSDGRDNVCIRETVNDKIVAERFFGDAWLGSHKGRLYDSADGLKDTLSLPAPGCDSRTNVRLFTSCNGKLIVAVDSQGYQSLYDISDEEVSYQLNIVDKPFTEKFREIIAGMDDKNQADAPKKATQSNPLLEAKCLGRLEQVNSMRTIPVKALKKWL